MTAMDRDSVHQAEHKKAFYARNDKPENQSDQGDGDAERHARNESAGYLAENDGHLFGKRLCDQISEVIGTFSR